jgi:ethanolamine utilization protein EutN
MVVGKVVGTVVATRKNDNLIGSKFLIVQPFDKMMRVSERFVAVDHVGAGIGETVLVATGSAARIGCNMENSPIDAAIVGIVDNITELE